MQLPKQASNYYPDGEAEKEEYTITSAGGKINIGREAKVKTADGFYRKNSIAFGGILSVNVISIVQLSGSAIA